MESGEGLAIRGVTDGETGRARDPRCDGWREINSNTIFA